MDQRFSFEPIQGHIDMYRNFVNVYVGECHKLQFVEVMFITCCIENVGSWPYHPFL